MGRLTQGLAQLFAGLLGFALTVSLRHDAMQAWGWRIPFFIGVAIVLVGLFIRNSLPETVTASGSRETPATLGEVLHRHAFLLPSRRW